jgi:hypothetical protein
MDRYGKKCGKTVVLGGWLREEKGAVAQAATPDTISALARKIKKCPCI